MVLLNSLVKFILNINHLRLPQPVIMSPLNPAATPFLPAITSLPTLSDAALISTLDLLFEPAPELHELALPSLRTISFNSYDEGGCLI